MVNRRRKATDSRKRLPMWAIAIVVALFLAGLGIKESNGSDNKSTDSTTAVAGEYGNLLEVVTNPTLEAEAVKYKGFDMSFNPKLHVPNWVAWELLGSETYGDEPRAKKFVSDESVAGCAEDYDYSYSGYDRGHMAPAGDMKWDPQAMKESFYMTNICPQDHSLNSGAWGNLEKKCRLWARHDSALMIVAGPVLTDKLTETIGDSHVAVPKRFFKVIVAPYAKPPRGIGFIMGNGKVEGGMQKAAVTIDEVEKVTGHDFFSQLPDEIENDVESQCDFHYWSTLAR